MLKYFRAIARNLKQLDLFEVTHVVNTAEGKKFNQIDTSSAYYQGAGIKYYGIPGVDIMNFPLHKYFYATADYIHEALESGGENMTTQTISASDLFLIFCPFHQSVTLGEVL